jgi:hypothetical protein
VVRRLRLADSPSTFTSHVLERLWVLPGQGRALGLWLAEGGANGNDREVAAPGRLDDHTDHTAHTAPRASR